MKMRVRSPVKLCDFDVIITPTASMPANNRPMAVSPDRRERRVITETPPIITAVPAAAPMVTGKPTSKAMAIPGNTPWASASATNANPRSTTNVPTTAHASATSTPAVSARARNALSTKGAMKN